MKSYNQLASKILRQYDFLYFKCVQVGTVRTYSGGQNNWCENL